jgi:hypothetical protein
MRASRRAGADREPTQTPIADTTGAARHGAGVRIGETVRRPGIGDDDSWHAVRDATRKIAMDEGLTMLIGPARDGTPPETGVPGPGGEDPVVIRAVRLRPEFYPFIGQR